MSNKIKILNVLEKEKELITTTELANKTRIDIRNITRYLKPLEQEGIIVRKTIQNGKIRVVKVGMNTEKPIGKAHPPIAPKPVIKIETLTPPPLTPKKIIPKIMPGSDYSNIDFEYIAKSSEFKRFVYFMYTGKTHRGTIKQLDQEIKRTKENLEIVNEMGRGTMKDRKALINELKQVLKAKKNKIQELN